LASAEQDSLLKGARPHKSTNPKSHSSVVSTPKDGNRLNAQLDHLEHTKIHAQKATSKSPKAISKPSTSRSSSMNFPYHERQNGAGTRQASRTSKRRGT
jgi:hypothetical protein